MPMYPYEELAAELRRRIQEGIYPPGSQLPSRHDLRVEFDVSDTVVGSALRMLRHEGLTESLTGMGTFVRESGPSDGEA